MMKKITTCLTALALVLCLGSGVGTAWAYFTTYASARGGKVIHLGEETRIDEETPVNWEKKVIISSASDSEPVFVRAGAFAGSEDEYTLTYSSNKDWVLDGTDWDGFAGDGWWYYYADSTGILEGGDQTTVFYVKIEDYPQKDDTSIENGDSFNVVVVYECIPVQYDADGNPLKPWEADWSAKVEGGVN